MKGRKFLGMGFGIIRFGEQDILEVRNCLFQYQSIASLFRGYLESTKRLNGTVFVPGTEKGHSGTTQQDFRFCMYEPIGTVLTVIPFNAPMNLFADKAASVLAAGNAVIAKPPSSNPLAVLKLVGLLWEASVPGDALQCITGSGSSVGKWMVSDPRVTSVTLTGSTEVGVEIAATLAKRLSPCALELGGNDPCISRNRWKRATLWSTVRGPTATLCTRSAASR